MVSYNEIGKMHLRTEQKCPERYEIRVKSNSITTATPFPASDRDRSS
ncbi:hypothetical protein [Phormidium sp. CCY1219]|nr:hypothetical protein [Phormidium sp. CCY1219]MEB3827744.1 hypothetical protein [Phormidium sp. CCY1219]